MDWHKKWIENKLVSQAFFLNIQNNNMVLSMDDICLPVFKALKKQGRPVGLDLLRRHVLSACLFEFSFYTNSWTKNTNSWTRIYFLTKFCRIILKKTQILGQTAKIAKRCVFSLIFNSGLIAKSGSCPPNGKHLAFSPKGEGGFRLGGDYFL